MPTYRIQSRRDTYANWAISTQVLLEGEIAINTTDENGAAIRFEASTDLGVALLIDKQCMKIGDGLNTWSNLNFVHAPQLNPTNGANNYASKEAPILTGLIQLGVAGGTDSLLANTKLLAQQGYDAFDNCTIGTGADGAATNKDLTVNGNITVFDVAATNVTATNVTATNLSATAVTASGPIDMGTNKITNVDAPTANGDAVNLETLQTRIDTAKSEISVSERFNVGSFGGVLYTRIISGGAVVLTVTADIEDVAGMFYQDTAWATECIPDPELKAALEGILGADLSATFSTNFPAQEPERPVELARALLLEVTSTDGEKKWLSYWSAPLQSSGELGTLTFIRTV